MKSGFGCFDMLCARFWVRQVRLYGQGEALPSWAEGCGNVMQSVVFTCLYYYVFEAFCCSVLSKSLFCMPGFPFEVDLRLFSRCLGARVGCQCRFSPVPNSLLPLQLITSLQSQTIQQFSTDWWIIPIKRIRQHYWPGKSEEANATCFWCKANSGSCN